MSILNKSSWGALSIAFAALFAAAPVLAERGDKPDKADRHAQKRVEQAEKRAEKQAQKADRPAWKHAKDEGRRADRRERGDIRIGAYFNDRHRDDVRSYYAQTYGGGRACPPGLAKKNNGCLPPGQAKKWVVGQPIPRGVVLYPVPQPVIVHLPPAPYGYRYVRLGGDIVLVQSGNNLIIDIIVGLG
ncbi:MAG: RcnB family protein [Ramlibacter sp.]|nr:RcnB family protein [Ramlibacter sp.]